MELSFRAEEARNEMETVLAWSGAALAGAGGGDAEKFAAALAGRPHFIGDLLDVVSVREGRFGGDGGVDDGVEEVAVHLPDAKARGRRPVGVA